MGYIGEIALILFATTIAGALSQRASMPIVIGQLLVGILLGPAVLGWVRPDSLLHAGAEIGVIILMFIAGLESDLQLLKKIFPTCNQCGNARCHFANGSLLHLWRSDAPRV